MNTIKVTHRDIAKMMVSALPVGGEEFGSKVEEYIDTIRALPAPAKVALKTAYIFSRKVPREEREDMFQDLAMAVLKTQTGDERLAYAVARCDWKNWWSKFKIRQHYSLDSVVDDGEGNKVALSELIIGECEFEIKANGDLDAQRIWDLLPGDIQGIVQKRLIQQPLTNRERARLSYWTGTQGYKVALA